MSACAHEAAKNVIFSLRLYNQHLIVDFAVTVDVLYLHCAAQDVAQGAPFGSRIPMVPDSGHAFGRDHAGDPAQKGV